MTIITLDTKHFDYNNIDEPLVAVPRSVLVEYLQNKKEKDITALPMNKNTSLIKNNIVNSKKKAVVNNKKATWVLTIEDIDRSYDIAMEEIRLGKTIRAEDVFKKYARV